MDKVYDPKKIEEPIYKFWEQFNCFEPDTTQHNKSSYCIILPPPNITGNLHLGHAFQQTIMDILIRFNRMKGKNTLWGIGLDHAGIATQILVENDIYEKTGKTRGDYTKDFLLQEIWKWKEKSEKSIIYQMKRLGNSVSWKNKRFTMDPELSFSVKEAFIRLYTDNLIYKRKKLVNWDSKLKTAISDLEVSYKKVQGSMWYIKYRFESIKHNCDINHHNQDHLVVATTRPETILGDVAIAVNPIDDRYHQFIGHYVLIPIINRRIPIISDKSVDINKGTGCVKIAPAHDFNDYVIANRHKLIMINILSTQNKKILKNPEIFNEKGQPQISSNYYIPKIFHNLDYDEAREIIIAECSKRDLLQDIKTHDLIIPYNNRTGTIIEPMLTNQWYIKTENLSKQAKYIVQQDIIKFIPKQYKKIYLQWMDNVQDWCISRQICWGHEIPAWYDDYDNIYVGYSEQDIRSKYQLNNSVVLHKDNDVLDTWFSSSLWTFSSLGWPNNINLLKYFHPADIVISGFDIIFFWIARMIMMTAYFSVNNNTKIQIPFKKVYITGLIRDEYGQKMSKSKGNIIDPLDLVDGISTEDLLTKRLNDIKALRLSLKNNSIRYTIKKQFPNGIKAYGADSLRLTLTSLSSSGRDIHWDINKLKGYHNFCNKLWHASRFILIHTHNQDCGLQNVDQKKILSLADRWIITKLHQLIQNFNQSLKLYRFDKVVNFVYEFVWHQFCDWYIEFTKPVLYRDKEDILNLRGTRYTLITSLETILRLAHPIVPFITEKIWQEVKYILGIKGKTIMSQSFPQYNDTMIDQNAVTNIEWMKSIISEIRIIRTSMGIAYNVPLKIALYRAPNNIKQSILNNYYILIKIAQLHDISFFEHNDTYDQAIEIILHESKLLIFIPNEFDKNIAIIKFLKKIKSINYDIDLIQQKLNKSSHDIISTAIFTKNQEKLNYYNKIKNRLLYLYSVIKKL